MTRLSSVGLSSKKMMTGHVMTGLSSFCFFLKGLMTKGISFNGFYEIFRPRCGPPIFSCPAKGSLIKEGTCGKMLHSQLFVIG